MLPIRIKACSESDLRMLGNLARNIQRVSPVTQADIDAAAALGKGWVVWKAIEVTDPIDNLRGGTQLVIKQNSITPGQNVRRVLIVQGPGGETVVIGPGPSPLLLPDAVADSLSYVKAFGGTERKYSLLPSGYTQLTFIESTKTQMIDTGYVLKDTDIVEVDYELTNLSATNDKFICGSHVESGSNIGNWVETFGTGNTWYIRFGSTSSVNAEFSNSQTSGTFIIKKGSFIVNGTQIATPTFTEMPSTNFTLFSRRSTGGAPATYGAYIRISECRIRDANSNEVIHRYVPCRRNSDRVLGLMDVLDNNFLVNVGTGTFIAGDVVEPTPSAPVDIVSNNGVIKYSKNLLDMSAENIVLGKYISNSGEILASIANFYNSKYIPVVGGETYAWSTSTSIRFISFMEYDSSKTFLRRTLIGTTGTPAGTSGSITMGSDTAFVLIGSNPTAVSITLDDIAAIDWQFEKGSSATAYSPAGIYTDGTVETINAHGKNLFNPATTTDGFIDANGVEQSTTLLEFSALIPVIAGQTYTWSGNSNRPTATNKILHGYDSNGNWVAQLSTDSVLDVPYSITATIPNGVAFVRISGIGTDLPDTDVQLETGSTATTYQPYYDGGTATAEMLLNIGGIVDEQEILGGNITRKVGYVVLDGTEDWSAVTNGYSAPVLDASLFNHLICTHFANGIPTTDLTCSKLAGSANLLIHYDAMTTVDAFKAFLASEYTNGTPVIVLYCLENETTESVAGQTLQVQAGDNTLEITQASLNRLDLEAEYTKTA